MRPGRRYATHIFKDENPQSAELPTAPRVAPVSVDESRGSRRAIRWARYIVPTFGCSLPVTPIRCPDSGHPCRLLVNASSTLPSLPRSHSAKVAFAWVLMKRPSLPRPGVSSI